jgi:hypothetical protein
MRREIFDEYLDKFNARDYAGALGFWAPDFELVVQQQVLCRSAADFRKFYGFLHTYIDESIAVDRFLSDERQLFLEARVRVAGKRDLTRAMIDAAGFDGFMPIAAGEVYEIPQFIHYHIEAGLFRRVSCLVAGPVQVPA